MNFLLGSNFYNIKCYFQYDKLIVNSLDKIILLMRLQKYIKIYERGHNLPILSNITKIQNLRKSHKLYYIILV